jgi:hypothetical protein
MHFSTKSYLKSNRNHTAKQTLSGWDKREEGCGSFPILIKFILPTKKMGKWSWSRLRFVLLILFL